MTSERYQPFSFAARFTVASIVGGELSMLTVARSVSGVAGGVGRGADHFLARALVPRRSGSPVHETTPDPVPSAQVNVTVTALSFQPAPFALGAWVWMNGRRGPVDVHLDRRRPARRCPRCRRSRSARSCTPSDAIATDVPLRRCPSSST